MVVDNSAAGNGDAVKGEEEDDAKEIQAGSDVDGKEKVNVCSKWSV